MRDPIEELKSTRVFSHLSSQSPEYADRAAQFVEIIAPILATTIQHFPLYTRHDAHHGFQVVRRLENVLLKDCLEIGSSKSLGAPELFLLIAAAYAHDLGMTVFPGEEPALRTTLDLPEHGWETSVPLTDYLRREHSKRGGAYIHQNALAMGVPENLVAPLDWIMKSHNLSVSELEANLRKPFAADGRVLDVRQLAAILCSADAIEFSDTRVLDGVVDLARQTAGDAAAISFRENRKHDCIRDSLAVTDDGQVVVSGTFDDGDVLALAHRTFDDMEGWIRGYCDIDRQSKIPRLKIRPEPFVRRLDLPGATFERLGVRMSKRAVIDLIASNAVWKRSTGAPIRELVQNAVEACRFRMHHSSPADDYQPQVRIEFDRARHTVTVTDNGCGMSLRTILNHFLSVASSRAKEPAYASKSYAPIARFGTGFWSVFTVATKADIRSLAFEAGNDKGIGLQFEVSLDELKDYTVFRDCPMSPGTSVTLSLIEDIVVDDVFEQCRNLLVRAAVPIDLVLDGVVEEIPEIVPDVTPTQLLGAKMSAMEADGLHTFQWRGERPGVEVAIGLVYRLEEQKVTFRLNEHTSVISRLDRTSGIYTTAVCGFFAPLRPSTICLDLWRVGTAVANIQSPQGIEYSLDRGQVLESEQSIKMGRAITQCIHDGYRAFLQERGAYNPESIYRLTVESELSGGNVFDQYTGHELSVAAEDYPDLLCFRLYEVAPSRKFQQATIHHLDWPGLRKLSGTCVVAQTRLSFPAPDGEFRGLYPEQLTELAYIAAAIIKHCEGSPEPLYLLEANRRASMLFDADPTGTVQTVALTLGPGASNAHLLMQRWRLQNLTLNPDEHQIIAEVQGRWTGALYSRDFENPLGTPYAFLGRHRVVIKTGSKLHEHCSALAEQKRLIKLADLIDDLQLHSQGFDPEAVRALI
ncbi:HD domain-containing protein [Quatrionicoccus australiensis]|uniref:HD domain-containing protein n=1 Tax=Quatrionicoccus australiensis TaxID=138118 RepID=UPI001CFBEC01|nr:ATP-binding protein [Quatrionicoccus australiensis]MCB4360406.1 ATP-binding protein [Quatrionicoccus australiensis]